jgi:hypothetical protein
MTDPARELADLCENLVNASYANGTRGDQVLAQHFAVNVWSTEFYQIIFWLNQRMDNLNTIVSSLEMDPDYQGEAITSIEAVRQAFSPNGLNNNWEHSLRNYICAQHVRPIKMLSSQVRKIQPYPKLSENEVAELTDLIDEFTSWLMDHQIENIDFIRQALIDGLIQFRFRLSKIGFLGWGYAIESLKEIVSAYMALERGLPPDAVNVAPVAEAMRVKASAFLKKSFDTAKVVKDVSDIRDLALTGYAAIASYGPLKQVIAGLLQ